MSAFGRRNGMGGMTPGARPQFGVARPMKGGSDAAKQTAALPTGGEQFPPLPGEELGGTMPSLDGPNPQGDAMSRLADRVNGVHENQYNAEGFEASVHKIKEQEIGRAHV